MQKIEVIHNRNDNIEILRAVAILLVLFIHIRAVIPFPSSIYDRLCRLFDGNSGVDLFFAISGFVITRSFTSSFSSNDSNTFSIIKAFWIKRAYRLLPAAALWLLIIILYSVLFSLINGSLWDGKQLGIGNLIPIFAALAYIFNFYTAYCNANSADTFWCGRYYLFIGHYWSLSLEQQFYFVLPIIFSILGRRLIKIMIVIIIALCFFWARPYFSYGWFFRIEGLCWGILLALLPIMNIKLPKLDKWMKKRIIVQTISLILIILLPYLSCRLQGFGTNTTRYGLSVLAVISAGLVFLAVRYENSLSAPFLPKKIMLYIGSRSYSIYIIHLIVFVILRHFWDISFGKSQFMPSEMRLVNLIIILLAFAVILILSEINYRHVEVRFRLKGKDVAKKIQSKG